MAREARGWGPVEVLARDDKEGRLTGSPGFDRAADYVIAQLRTLGLQPAGSGGFVQPVELSCWANRYHSPQDDLAQPVMKAEAGKLNDYVAALVGDIADDPKRPQWLPDSYFRSFAK
jgi:hypothetical protein